MIKKDYASQCSSKQGLPLSAKDCKIDKCDHTCINSTINFCQHVIAVAENCGKLPGFVQWFRRSKSIPLLTGLTLNGVPKLVGKKPSNRKREGCHQHWRDYKLPVIIGRSLT